MPCCFQWILLSFLFQFSFPSNYLTVNLSLYQLYQLCSFLLYPYHAFYFPITYLFYFSTLLFYFFPLIFTTIPNPQFPNPLSTKFLWKSKWCFNKWYTMCFSSYFTLLAHSQTTSSNKHASYAYTLQGRYLQTKELHVNCWWCQSQFIWAYCLQTSS